MAISLHGITLPAGLQWTDEYSEKKVTQDVKRTLAGSVVIYYGSKPNGNLITLASGSDHGWVTRSVVDQLQALAETAGQIMTLAIRSTTYQVMFAHQAGSAFDAEPLFPMANPSATDYYRVKLVLMTV